MEYQYNVGLGILPDPGVTLVSGPDDPRYQAMTTPEQRAEADYFANVLGIGTGLGGIAGAPIGTLSALAYALWIASSGPGLMTVASVAAWAGRGFLVGGPVGAVIGGGGALRIIL